MGAQSVLLEFLSGRVFSGPTVHACLTATINHDHIFLIHQGDRSLGEAFPFIEVKQYKDHSENQSHSPDHMWKDEILFSCLWEVIWIFNHPAAEYSGFRKEHVPGRTPQRTLSGRIETRCRIIIP